MQHLFLTTVGVRRTRQRALDTLRDANRAGAVDDAIAPGPMPPETPARRIARVVRSVPRRRRKGGGR